MSTGVYGEVICHHHLLNQLMPGMKLWSGRGELTTQRDHSKTAKQHKSGQYVLY